jgi:hypothetical protein
MSMLCSLKNLYLFIPKLLMNTLENSYNDILDTHSLTLYNHLPSHLKILNICKCVYKYIQVHRLLIMADFIT